MKKLLLAGALLCSAGLASALLLPVGNETVLTTREATQENLLPVSGFDDADFSQTFTSGVFNQWTVHKAADESSAVDIALVDDAERGQVASYTGKPNSWYTSFIAQRIEGEFVPGIYRLTFWAKSDNSGKAKVFFRTTNAAGEDQQRFFIKETGRPEDLSQKYYGSYYNPTVTAEWAQYSVEFNFSTTSTSMYSFSQDDAKTVTTATTDDLTNFSLCIQGDNANADKTFLIDDVELTLIEDLSPDEPENPGLTGENIIPTPEFDGADFTKTFDSGVFNEWVTLKGPKETGDISMSLVDDSERGQVACYSGKPASWYTSYIAQRIEGSFPAGIYRLTFWAKSDDGGKGKIFLRTTDAGGADLNDVFINETARPEDEAQKFYGGFYNPALTTEWTQYSVDFNFTLVTNSMYSFAMNDDSKVSEATSDHRTNFSICIQGDNANDGKSFLIDDVQLTLIEDLSEPEDPDQPTGENLLADSGFDAATTEALAPAEAWDAAPGKWTAYRDVEEKNPDVQIAIEQDGEQGNVLSIEGNSSSWYTTLVGQFLDGTLERGIYRLTFKARSDNGAQLRVTTRCTGEENTFIAGQNRFFVLANGAPVDPDEAWRGAYSLFSLTPSWQEYSVEYNLTQVTNTQYDMTYNANVSSATEVDLTNPAVLFYNNRASSKLYLDDVQFAKVGDVEEEPAIVRYNFEEASVPAEWTATGSSLALSTFHHTEGTQSLAWAIDGDNAVLELDLGNGYAANSRNSAFFNIYSLADTGDGLTVEFLDANDAVLKQANLTVNFKGWREFSRPYNEYENTADGTVAKLRFTYNLKEGNTEPADTLFIDHMDLNYGVDNNRQYPDMMVKDFDFLSADNAHLLKFFAYKGDEAVAEPTDEELAGLETLRNAYKRTASANLSRLRTLINQIRQLNLTRNADGTVQYSTMIDPAEVTPDYLLNLSQDVEAMAAAYIGGNAQVTDLFPLYMDYLLDQGVFYYYGGMTWSNYTSVRGVASGFLDGMNAYTDEQKREVCKGIQWIWEVNQAYAPAEVAAVDQSSDYIHLALADAYGSLIFMPDAAEAVEGARAMTRLLENFSQYSAGGEDVLKPDGTGFHHNSHYNNYMYAYDNWVLTLHNLIGTPFQVSEGAYQRLRKAVVSMYLMASKDASDTHIFANSLAGRHPLSGGNEMPFGKSIMSNLVEVGADILGTEDTELQSYYNYFMCEELYPGVQPAYVEGFHQFNYSPVGIYRLGNWVATMRCPTTKFWGAEIYSGTNRLGRYQSHGTLEIVYDGALEVSGLPADDGNSGTLETGGWDWNVVPGATTVHYTDWQQMMPNGNTTDRFDQYSRTTNFSGALAWGNCGMFGAEFDQIDTWGSQRFTPTNLQFKKSVYAFDGMLISLGSNISATGEYGDDMITATNLFQGIDSDVSGDLIVNGSVMAAGSDPVTNPSTEDLRIVTPQGTGYIVPKGNDEIDIFHGEQSSPNETGSNIDSPVTVTAAKAYINHGVKPAEERSYQFVVVPGTNDADLAALESRIAAGEVYEVLAQNAQMHVLNYKPTGVTAYTLFGAADALDYGYVQATGSEMLLMERFDQESRYLALAVCNPNLRPEDLPEGGWRETPTETSITVEGEWELYKDVEGVTLTPGEGTTLITLTLEKGEPVYLTLINENTNMSGIGDQLAGEGMKVTAAGRTINVQNVEGTVNVYNVAGQLVKAAEADGSASFYLEQPGCYIVKAGNQTAKVMLR